MLPAGVPDHQLDLSSSGQQLGGDQHRRISFLRSLHLISPHQTEILNSLWPLRGHFLLFNSNSEWILGVSWFGRWQPDSLNICRQFAEDVHETMTQQSAQHHVKDATWCFHEDVRRYCFDHCYDTCCVPSNLPWPQTSMWSPRQSATLWWVLGSGLGPLASVH